MTICDAIFNQKYSVILVTAPEPIRSRLNAIGFSKGSSITVLDFTLHKQTYKIEVDGTKVAIRKEEATKIEIGDNNE